MPARDLADRGRGVGHARRGLVVDEGHDLRPHLRHRPLQALQVDRPAQLDVEGRHRRAGALHDLLHEAAEDARHDHDHAVAWLDEGDRGRLEPGAPRSRHRDHLAGGLEHLAEIQARGLEDLVVERRLVLDHRRLRHRADDAPGDLGRAGDHQDRAVESSSPVLGAHAVSPLWGRRGSAATAAILRRPGVRCRQSVRAAPRAVAPGVECHQSALARQRTSWRSECCEP